jgi:hypothetical protein
MNGFVGNSARSEQAARDCCSHVLIIVGEPRRFQLPDLIARAATPCVQRVRTELDNRQLWVSDTVKQLLDQPIRLPANVNIPLLEEYRPVIIVIGGAGLPHWLATKKIGLFRKRV